MPPSGQQLGLGLGLSTGTTPSNKLLDQFGGAAAAYSLQDLSRVGGTNVVRARRSTDDAEQNFTAGGVSGGVLRNFALNNDADLIRFADQATAADKRMYFDGVNNYVTGPTVSASEGRITMKFCMTAPQTQFARLAGLRTGAGDELLLNFRDAAGLQLSCTVSNTHITSGILNVGQIYEATVAWGAGTTTLYIDGVSVGSFGATALTGGEFRWGSQGISFTANNFEGIIYDCKHYSDVDGTTLVNSYNGYGNTNADWTDQVGSNDGTVLGSPALFSGQGFDAYVTTLYDQSGNGRDATQATAASQPQIVADGVVVTDGNGLETITFDGVDDFLHTASFTVAQPDTIFTKFQSDTNPNEGAIVDGNSDRQLFDSTDGAWQIFAGSRVTGGTRDANENLASILFNGASSQLWVNGSSVITGDPSTNSITDGIRLGTNKREVDPLSGSISELIIYPSDQSANRSAIEANIASRYGITLA